VSYNEATPAETSLLVQKNITQPTGTVLHEKVIVTQPGKIFYTPYVT
jgi:hypothetical protein